MTPGSDPEIPSLKPLGGKEEEKKGGAALPSTSKPATPSGFKFPGFGGGSTGASKAFSAPNLKVRGLSGGGSTVMERLKNLRKKDLIFIGAGLCTLGMAPLAEHLLMSPDEQTAKLQEGFNSQQGPLFQDGSSVYEPGNGVGSPGGLVGQGSDVITPLNVRDPSNLIMSPGAQKKADAVVAPPPSSPAPSKGENDWKDVLRDSARSGAGKAVSQSPKLPKPNAKMAGAIRGLSALGGGGGGTGASLKLDPLSASNVPNKAAGSGALTRSQAAPGFRGATSRSGASSGAGEDLRAAGSRQSDIFNRGGGAAAALDAASREAIPAGGSAGGAGGRPGEGGETKNPGGNSQKDNKSLGESLAFLRQKMEMEKSLDLKWEKKKWNQFGRQKMLEESAIKLGFDMFGKFAEKAVIGPLGDFIGQSIVPGGSPGGIACNYSGSWKNYPNGGGKQYVCAATDKAQVIETGKPPQDFSCPACGKLAGGGAGGAAAGENSPYQNPTPRLPGPPASNYAGQVGTTLGGAYAKVCTKDAGGYLGEPLCGQLMEMQGYVSTHLGKAEEHKNNAETAIGAAYTAMQNEVGARETGAGATGLGGIVSATGESPLKGYLTSANEAVKELGATGEQAALAANTKAKTLLLKAKSAGVDLAIGSEPPPAEGLCSQQVGGMAKVACTAKQDAEDYQAEVVKQLGGAADKIALARDSIKAGQDALGDKYKPADGLKPGHISVFESYRKDSLAAFTGISAAVDKTAAQKKTADDVNAGKIKAAKVEFDKAMVSVENLFAPNAASGVVAQAKDDVWVKPVMPVTPPAPQVTPVKSATDANKENLEKISALHDVVVKGEKGAQTLVTGTAQPLKDAKGKVSECIGSYDCKP